jgi:hypothetical protein
MMRLSLKRSFLVVIAVLAAQVFGSCYSYPIKSDSLTDNQQYWDESLSKEESVELFIVEGITVTSYNEISVDWGRKALVFLPPGETVFIMDLKFRYGNTIYSGSSIFAWNFKAGSRFALQGWVKDGKPGIILADLDVKRKPEECDFFPFPEKGKTVLQ